MGPLADSHVKRTETPGGTGSVISGSTVGLPGGTRNPIRALNRIIGFSLNDFQCRLSNAGVSNQPDADTWPPSQLTVATQGPFAGQVRGLLELDVARLTALTELHVMRSTCLAALSHQGIRSSVRRAALVRRPARLSAAPLQFDCRGCFSLRSARDVV